MPARRACDSRSSTSSRSTRRRCVASVRMASSGHRPPPCRLCSAPSRTRSRNASGGSCTRHASARLRCRLRARRTTQPASTRSSTSTTAGPSREIVNAFGGTTNVAELAPVAPTRLRIIVHDESCIDAHSARTGGAPRQRARGRANLARNRQTGLTLRELRRTVSSRTHFSAEPRIVSSSRRACACLPLRGELFTSGIRRHVPAGDRSSHAVTAGYRARSKPPSAAQCV